MKCPYCVEEIQQGAVTCRHCHHDLAFFAPVQKSLAELMAEVRQLTERVTVIEDAETVAPVPSHPKIPPATLVGQLKIGLISLALQVLFGLLIASNVGDLSEFLFLFLVFGFLLGPLFTGFWAGAAWRGRHTLAYMGWGFLCGAGGWLSASWGNELTFAGEDGMLGMLYMAAHVLTFLAGGLLGDWMEAHRAGSGSDSFSQRLARLAVGKHPGKGTAEERSSRLAQYISAFAPLMTFAASVIASLLTYQSAVQKMQGQ